MEPSKNSTAEAVSKYRKFSEKMYEWIKNPEDKKQLLTNPGFGNQSVKWYTGGENNENKKINNEVFVNNP